jgi:hypothetical protein
MAPVNPSVWMLIALGVVTAFATLTSVLNYLINRRMSRQNNFLVKALKAENVAELAGAEATPEEHIEVLKTENELATNAKELVDQERYIPI